SGFGGLCDLQDNIEDNDILVFFFFQAEDGIRDKLVTGVQTCALPIWRRCSGRYRRRPSIVSVKPSAAAFATCRSRNSRTLGNWRSEERRVGKECRSGRSR